MTEVAFQVFDSIVRVDDVRWCTAAFFVLYLAHILLYKSLPFIMSLVVEKKSADIVSSKTNLMKLSRFTIDASVMAIFSYLGFLVLDEFHGWNNFYTDGSNVFSRVYQESPSAITLCRLQVAYEAKNLLDSCIFGDGAVFVIHHICTGTLAVFALNPFLHLYSSFFFGISEVSTTVLCVLACFDDSRGIKGKNGENLFAKLFPTAMKVIGVLFAVLFVIIRVIMWPVISYYFWIDSLALLELSVGVHSRPVVNTFLVFNVGLTILQLAWLAEIIMHAVRLFTGEGIKSSIVSTLDDDYIQVSGRNTRARNSNRNSQNSDGKRTSSRAKRRTKSKDPAIKQSSSDLFPLPTKSPVLSS